MFRPTRFAALIALLFVPSLFGSARAGIWMDPLQNDAGTYEVYFRDRLLGTEKFSFEPKRDSVLIYSSVSQILPTPDGDKSLEKRMEMTVKALDYGMVSYHSDQNFLKRHVVRGVNVHDTTMTTYRESGELGSAETYERPPGRFFVVDGQVFVLFDVMLRSLHGKMFGDRPLAVVVLGEPRDSVMDIRFQPGRNDTLQIGSRAWPTQQVRFTDGTTEFLAWVSRKGVMLRLVQPETGLRVERILRGREPPVGSTPVNRTTSRSGSPPAPGR